MAIEDLGPIFDAEGNEVTAEQIQQAVQPQNGNAPGWRRKLEEDAEAGKQAIKDKAASDARAEAAERRAALLEAGVDLNSDLGKFFADSYKGEPTVEAITAQASKIGLIAASKDPVVQEELAAMDRIAGASSGTGGAPAEDDPEQAIAKFDGQPEEFDAWFAAKYGTPQDRSKDVKWLKPESQGSVPVRN